jgi:hypothetical protein
MVPEMPLRPPWHPLLDANRTQNFWVPHMEWLSFLTCLFIIIGCSCFMNSCIL